MADRKPLSKRVRFEVFKRDGFVCQYCGAHPPHVLLHADHIVPVAEGGGNEETNLITACQPCNQGKSDVPLSVVPKSLGEKAAEIEEREAQIAGYRDVIRARESRIDDDAWEVAETLIPGCRKDGLRKDWFRSIKMFNDRMDMFEVKKSAEAAYARQRGEYARFKYFCGICWKKIKEASPNG